MHIWYNEKKEKEGENMRKLDMAWQELKVLIEKSGINYAESLMEYFRNRNMDYAFIENTERDTIQYIFGGGKVFSGILL